MGLRQVRWLHEKGRMFPERDHVHTLLYRFAAGTSDGGEGVPAELTLDHPYGGLISTVVDLGDGALPADVLRSHVAHAHPRLAFTPIPLPDDAPVKQQGLDRLDRRLLVLAFLPDDPRDVWDAHRAWGEGLQESGTGTVAWTSPFIPTIPGTDTYTDHLW